MALTITCPGCGLAGRPPARALGLTVMCARCGNQFSLSWSRPPKVVTPRRGRHILALSPHRRLLALALSFALLLVGLGTWVLSR